MLRLDESERAVRSGADARSGRAPVVSRHGVWPRADARFPGASGSPTPVGGRGGAARLATLPWTSPPDEGWDLELDDQLLRHATSQEISTLPRVPGNDVERRLDLALRWFERGQLAADPLEELLYLFFALEAILGDKSEGLKAPALAVRRAILGLVTRDGFIHPAGRTSSTTKSVRPPYTARSLRRSAKRRLTGSRGTSGARLTSFFNTRALRVSLSGPRSARPSTRTSAVSASLTRC